MSNVFLKFFKTGTYGEEQENHTPPHPLNPLVCGDAEGVFRIIVVVRVFVEPLSVSVHFVLEPLVFIGGMIHVICDDVFHVGWQFEPRPPTNAPMYAQVVLSLKH